MDLPAKIKLSVQYNLVIACLRNEKGGLLKHKKIVKKNMYRSDKLYYCDMKRIIYINFSPA